MDNTRLMRAFYALTGFCVGALVGMTGVSGGSLMTPLLILLFGVHPVAAVGTDLLYAAVTMHGAAVTPDHEIVNLPFMAVERIQAGLRGG